MDKLKLAEWGERLKTGGAQMGRVMSDKMKEILQIPALESKMVDEATREMLPEPNWGMNMRVCAMINSREFSGTEIARAIKRKISGKSPASQRLSLELLEACAMNCGKAFAEAVASERVMDEMVRVIKTPETEPGVRDMASRLLRAWGESEELACLPVFRQAYMSLEGEDRPSSEDHVDSVPLHYSGGEDGDYVDDFGSLSIDEKRKRIVESRSSLELLSSMLRSAEAGTKRDELMVNLVDKCKQSRPIIQTIIRNTVDDEGMLFEALHLNDELQRVISTYEEVHSSPDLAAKLPENNSQTNPELKGGPTKTSNAAESNTDRDVVSTNETKEDGPFKIGSNESFSDCENEK